MVRRILFAALLATLGAAASQILRLDRQLDIRSHEAVAGDAALQGLRTRLLDLRATERAALAPTQGVPFWRERLERQLAGLAADTTALRTAAREPSARAAMERLGTAVSELTRVERRIVGHLDAGRLPHAEDLVYADAVQASLAVERELALAGRALAEEGSAVVTLTRRRQAIVAACGLLAWVTFAVALMRRVSRMQAEAASPEPEAASTLGLGGTGSELSLRGAGEMPPAAATPRPLPAPAPPRVPERAASPAALQATAEVCSALARVKESRDLPALVERLSAVLDARGTIVWLCDEERRQLRPALSFGYPSPVIGRMGAIPLDGGTPAAHAFRLAEPRVVSGPGDGASALVVPIVAAGGPTGVITVELPPGNERHPATLALARIFAAQLAGLVGGGEPAPVAASVSRGAGL